VTNGGHDSQFLVVDVARWADRMNDAVQRWIGMSRCPETRAANDADVMHANDLTNDVRPPRPRLFPKDMGEDP
jgi:hypothetical protein